MANYFVVLEPMMLSQISAVEKTLANLPTPVHRVLATTWFVNSPLSLDKLFDLFSAIALPGDRFLIVDAAGCRFDNLLVPEDVMDGCWDATMRRI